MKAVLVQITPGMLDALKNALRKSLVTVRPGHLSEALASGFGFATYASLLSEGIGAWAAFDQDAFDQRLAAMGLPVTFGNAADGTVRSTAASVVTGKGKTSSRRPAKPSDKDCCPIGNGASKGFHLLGTQEQSQSPSAAGQVERLLSLAELRHAEGVRQAHTAYDNVIAEAARKSDVAKDHADGLLRYEKALLALNLSGPSKDIMVAASEQALRDFMHLQPETRSTGSHSVFFDMCLMVGGDAYISWNCRGKYTSSRLEIDADATLKAIVGFRELAAHPTLPGRKAAENRSFNVRVSHDLPDTHGHQFRIYGYQIQSFQDSCNVRVWLDTEATSS